MKQSEIQREMLGEANVISVDCVSLHPAMFVVTPYCFCVNRENDKIRNLFFAAGITVLLSSNALAKDVNSIEADVLTKTSVSWDGEALPDYARGAPEITILRVVIPPGDQRWGVITRTTNRSGGRQ